MKKNLLKKAAALALSASMLLSMTASAFAAGLESGSPAGTAKATVTQPGAADNDELFDQYVEGLFYGGGVQTYSTTSGRDKLDAELQAAYTTLLSKIKKIASGEESSTELTNLNIKITVANEEEFKQKVGKVLDALLLDCSSELYWYDKTAGTSFGIMSNGSSYILSSVLMKVASSYRGANEYTTDPAKISAANKAVKNAEDIVKKAPSGDAEKVKYFKDEICKLVSYDTAAANGGAYGDSFQLTNVFDGDEKTNVVCEGYSKAFKYLCELADIECYTVTGTMKGGTGAGAHMWNLVVLDGKSYVVDVTNCDTGTIGSPDKLCLKGVELISNGYKVAGVTYMYDSDTTSLISKDILTPSTLSYGEKPHSHTFSTEWSKDDTYHWHAATCEHKDESIDKEAHKWDEGKVTTQPTETSKGVKTFTCAICNATKTEDIAKLEHSHTFSEEWSKDDTNHWHTCSGCDELIDKEAHKWDDGKITTPATESAKGVKTFTCTVCGATKTEEIPHLAHTHKPSEVWSNDDTNHWHTCSGCDELLEKAAHDWDDGVITTKPTENKEGVKTFTCTTCKATKTEAVSKLEHTHTFTLTPAKNATCTEAGNIAYNHCSACGKYFSEDGATEITLASTVIPAKGHTYPDTWEYDDTSHWHECECGNKTGIAGHSWNVVIIQPTEAAEGKKTSTCTVCGKVVIETIPKLDPGHTHSLTLVPEKKPTCTETGNLAYYTCTCGKWFTDSEGTAEISDHNSVILPMISHSISADWSHDDGFHWHTCSGCDGKLDFTPHTWDNGVITTQPTEEKDGVKTFTCTVCERTRTESIPALQHSHELEYIAAITPACTRAGNIAHYHCKKCGKNYSDSEGSNEIADVSLSIDSTNHAGGTEIRGAVKATCIANGYTGDTHCLGCGAVLSYGKTIYASSSGHSFRNGVCRYCGVLQYSYMYRPTITYLNDTYHFYSGMARLHKPDSHGLYTDSFYQWYVCAECGHEYGRTSRWIQPGSDDSGAIDIVVDDPVECGDDELLFTVR